MEHGGFVDNSWCSKGSQNSEIMIGDEFGGLGKKQPRRPSPFSGMTMDLSITDLY